MDYSTDIGDLKVTHPNSTSTPTSSVFAFSPKMGQSNYDFNFLNSSAPPDSTSTAVSESKDTKITTIASTSSVLTPSTSYTDYSGYDFTYAAPQNLTSVSELKNAGVVTTTPPSSIFTPSASIFTTAAPIFTVYNASVATVTTNNTNTETQAPSATPLTRYTMSGPAKATAIVGKSGEAEDEKMEEQDNRSEGKDKKGGEDEIMGEDEEGEMVKGDEQEGNTSYEEEDKMTEDGEAKECQYGDTMSGMEDNIDEDGNDQDRGEDDMVEENEESGEDAEREDDSGEEDKEGDESEEDGGSEVDNDRGRKNNESEEQSSECEEESYESENEADENEKVARSGHEKKVTEEVVGTKGAEVEVEEAIAEDEAETGEEVGSDKEGKEEEEEEEEDEEEEKRDVTAEGEVEYETIEVEVEGKDTVKSEMATVAQMATRKLAPLKGRFRASVPSPGVPAAPISAVSTATLDFTCSAPPTLTLKVITSTAVTVASLYVLSAANITTAPFQTSVAESVASDDSFGEFIIPSDDSWTEFIVPDTSGEAPGYWGDVEEGGEEEKVLEEAKSSDGGLSDPESDSGDEALGWAPPGSSKGDEKEEVSGGVEKENKAGEEESRLLLAAEMVGRKVAKLRARNPMAAENKPKAEGAFGLSETAISDIFGVSDAPAATFVSTSVSVSVSASASPLTLTTPHTSAPSVGEVSSEESLSSAKSDEADEVLGWTIPKDKEAEEDKEEKEKVPVLTSAPTDTHILPLRIRNPTFIPPPRFVPTSDLTFAAALIEGEATATRPYPPPVLITGRWVRERRGSRKEWVWVPEADMAESQQDEGRKEEEEAKEKAEEDKMAEMERVGEWYWSLGSDTVLAEKAATTTTITIEAGTNLREDAPSTGEDIAMPIKVGPDPVSVSEIETERFRSWSVPVGPLLLVLFGVVTWFSGVVESLAGNAFWDGLEAVLDVSAWELVAPLETVLLRAVSEVLPVGTGMTMLALFLSVVFVCTYGIAQKHGAAKSLGRVFEWAVRAISGIGVVIGAVVRWRAALAMTTTEGGVAFTPPIRITVVKWKELAVVLCRVEEEERGEVDGKEKSLPIEFVSTGDIAPAVDMCPRHELGIGAGTRASGGGVGGSFGLGLFSLGFVVWGSGGKRLHRSRERR